MVLAATTREIAISREKDARERTQKRPRTLASLCLRLAETENQSILEATNILTFMTKGAADVPLAQSTRTFRTSRLVGSFVEQ